MTTTFPEPRPDYMPKTLVSKTSDRVLDELKTDPLIKAGPFQPIVMGIMMAATRLLAANVAALPADHQRGWIENAKQLFSQSLDHEMARLTAPNDNEAAE